MAGSPPPGEVVATGGGTLALGNAANSYSGGTTVIEGSTVTINDNGELGALTGGLTLGDATTSGTLATISTLASARAITLAAGGGSFDVKAATTATLSGTIGGAGGLTKTDAGTLILTGTDNYTGGTTVSAGTLKLGSGGSLASTTALTINGGSFDLENGGQTVGGLAGGSGGTLVLGNGFLTVNQAGPSSFDGLVTGARGLKIEGGGTLALGNAANDYGAGTTVIGGSTLSIAAGGALGNSNTLILGDSTTSGTLATTANLSSATFVLVETGGGRFDVADGTTATLTGEIGGLGVLTKTDTGTLILTDPSSSAAGITVDAGTLRVGAGGHLSTGGAFIVNGGTFDVERQDRVRRLPQRHRRRYGDPGKWHHTPRESVHDHDFRRPDRRHRRPVQVRHRNADPHRHQRLHRRHVCERRQAGARPRRRPGPEHVAVRHLLRRLRSREWRPDRGRPVRRQRGLRQSGQWQPHCGPGHEQLLRRRHRRHRRPDEVGHRDIDLRRHRQLHRGHAGRRRHAGARHRQQPGLDRRAHRQWRRLRSREWRADRGARFPAPAAPSPWAEAASP